MTTLQIMIRKLWVRIEEPVWSFIVNTVFWLFRLNKIGPTRKKIDRLKVLPLSEVMARFRWRPDSLKDWTPWIMTIVYNDLQDDCDGAAALARWWLQEQGIKADILFLYSAKTGHAVCVTRDKRLMVTNECVVELDPAAWERDMMKYFGNQYTVII